MGSDSRDTTAKICATRGYNESRRFNLSSSDRKEVHTKPLKLTNFKTIGFYLD